MFSGSMVAIVTPMTADGAWTGRRGTGCWIFTCVRAATELSWPAPPGESPVLSAAEVEELTRRAVARCRDKSR